MLPLTYHTQATHKINILNYCKVAVLTTYRYTETWQSFILKFAQRVFYQTQVKLSLLGRQSVYGQTSPQGGTS